ncbi:unnamed protein product, partial [marine sediment metagenome]
DTIALSILNCPIAMGVPIMSDEAIISRRQVLERLLEQHIFSRTKGHHLLGCFAPREIEWIEKIKMTYGLSNIETIDTSLAVTCGMRGIWFDTSETGVQFGKPKEKLDFSTKVPKKFYSVIEHNIKYIKNLAKELLMEKIERYEKLTEVFDLAMSRITGKGDSMHGDDNPIEKQLICNVTRKLGLAFPLGQCTKKVYESQRLEKDLAIKELLDAINYLAAAVIVLKEYCKEETNEKRAKEA